MIPRHPDARAVAQVAGGRNASYKGGHERADPMSASPRTAQDTDPPGFTNAWIAAYQARLPGYRVRPDPSHTVDRPTSKTFGFEAYGVPTATYEIGDDTDRALIVRLGSASTEAMMATMMEMPAP